MYEKIRSKKGGLKNKKNPVSSKVVMSNNEYLEHNPQKQDKFCIMFSNESYFLLNHQRRKK